MTGGVARTPRTQLDDGIGAFADDRARLFDRPAARGRNRRRHRLRRNGGRDGEEVGIQRGTGVAPLACVQSDSGAFNDSPQQAIIYRFSVNRGMAIALVIETPHWHSGLLQAALARVRIEGQN